MFGYNFFLSDLKPIYRTKNRNLARPDVTSPYGAAVTLKQQSNFTFEFFRDAEALSKTLGKYNDEEKKLAVVTEV